MSPAASNMPLSQPARAESSHEDRGRPPLGMNPNMEYMNVTIPSDPSTHLHIEINPDVSTESSAHPTRTSSPRLRHANRLPRTIYADGIPYTRGISADRVSPAINEAPVPSPETTRIKKSPKHSIHSRSDDQEWDSLESRIRSAPADTAL